MSANVSYLTSATDLDYTPALGYIRNLGADILRIASLLNVSAAAIAGQMAEEHVAYLEHKERDDFLDAFIASRPHVALKTDYSLAQAFGWLDKSPGLI